MILNNNFRAEFSLSTSLTRVTKQQARVRLFLDCSLCILCILYLTYGKCHQWRIAIFNVITTIIIMKTIRKQ